MLTSTVSQIRFLDHSWKHGTPLRKRLDALGVSFPLRRTIGNGGSAGLEAVIVTTLASFSPADTCNFR
ncbi:hypothetical protein VTN31DRAFT_2158 [Thermomyces dupontii]|uniref:uncharacterized protein n=1 Tax=Talaromyces thermophilus TaxID=28565 RepID=UPI003744ACDC